MVYPDFYLTSPSTCFMVQVATNLTEWWLRVSGSVSVHCTFVCAAQFIYMCVCVCNLFIYMPFLKRTLQESPDALTDSCMTCGFTR